MAAQNIWIIKRKEKEESHRIIKKKVNKLFWNDNKREKIPLNDNKREKSLCDFSKEMLKRITL